MKNSLSRRMVGRVWENESSLRNISRFHSSTFDLFASGHSPSFLAVDDSQNPESNVCFHSVTRGMTGPKNAE